MAASSTPEDSVISHIVYILFVIASFVMVIVSLPLLLPISLMFRIYRHTQIRIIKNHYPEAMMVSGEDAVWLQDSTENPAIINCLVHLDGKCDIKHFQEIVQDRLVNAKDELGQIALPKLKRYSTKLMHRFVWVEEDHFDIKDHVFLHEKRLPTNITEMHEITGDMISRGLPEKKSPWQFIILPYKDNGLDTFLMLARIHHSIGDGIGLMRMVINNLVDEKPPELSSKRFGTKNAVLNMLRGIFLGPAILLEKLVWPRDSNILHGPKPCGKKLISWSSPIDLDLIKKIKNHTGSTVNDVLVSCLGGALNQYFKESNAEIPDNVSLYVPVDIRSKNSGTVLDNQFALVFLSLPTSMNDSIERLNETKRRMDQIKSSPEPIINALTIRYAMSRLPKWMTKMVFDWFSNKCSIILSNVPGPQQVLSVGGHNISGIIFWPPQRNYVGVGVSIMSYNGDVRIGVMVDDALTNNPDKIVSAFINNVNHLAANVKAE